MRSECGWSGNRRNPAGMRQFAVKYAGSRRKRIRAKMAYWWLKLGFPIKKAFLTLAARVKSRKTTDAGLMMTNLHSDVQTCGYSDVQVMWEMLRRSDMEVETSSSDDHHRHHDDDDEEILPQKPNGR